MSSFDALRLALPHVEGTEQLYVRGAYSLSAAGHLVADRQERVSLGTWFNAAPVAWWSQLLPGSEATMHVVGEGAMRVAAVSDSGDTVTVASNVVAGPWSVPLPVGSDYRFAWLELEPDSRLSQHRWEVTRASEPGVSSQSITVVVPTFKREDDALDQVDYLLESCDSVGRVVVVDQGDTIAGHPRTPALQARHNERFVLLEQGNYGGSGGYSRGMRESLRWEDDFVLLLDDDAHMDAESLRRAFELSRRVSTPTVVGTGLISAETGTDLEAFAEGISPTNFQWGPIDGVTEARDMCGDTPQAWSFLDPGAVNDYCGWWGCLLPAGAVKSLGLAAPFFIKWDDAEYGLRARSNGYRIATIPGVSVWHPTWAAKQTSASWSSWMMHRNRFAVGAAYGTGRGIVKDSLIHQIKHILSGQYDTANLWEKALDQFLSGPQWLGASMIEARNISQAEIDRFAAQLHEPKPDAVETAISSWDYGLAGVNLLMRKPMRSRTERVVSPAQYTWRVSVGVAQTRVVDPDSGAAVRSIAIDPALARAQLLRAVKQHVLLALKWSRLRKTYSREVVLGQSTWSRLLPST